MPILTDISDPDDPRLALYRNVKDRDLSGREGLFMAEGKVVLERLVSSPLAQAVSVLTTPERLGGLDVSALDEQVPVYAVPQQIMDKVAGFDIHRGYLALGRYGPVPDLSEALKREHIRVLALSEIANTDNMGGLMRNAAAFGVDAVVLDHRCCDPLYRKALRVSVGGALQVPHYRLEKGANLVDALLAHNLTPYALSPSGRIGLEDLVPAARSAIIMGAEGPGLSAGILQACQSVRIDMHAGFDSLNVATTAGIVLYHLTR